MDKMVEPTGLGPAYRTLQKCCLTVRLRPREMVVGAGLAPALFPVSQIYSLLPSLLGTPHEMDPEAGLEPATHGHCGTSHYRLCYYGEIAPRAGFKPAGRDELVRINNPRRHQLRFTLECGGRFSHALGNRSCAWQAEKKRITPVP